MPTQTTLGQSCTVYLDAEGLQRFKIESSIDYVKTGDLPQANIFVFKINAPTDPKADTFLRVGNVADVTTYAIDRDVAVAKNQTIWLSTEFTVTYDDIATASQAKLLIQQRVDNLIADWHAYNEQFLAPVDNVSPHRSDTEFPLTNSLEAQRKAAYNTAHAAYLAAKSTQSTAAANLAAAVSASGVANNSAIAAVTDSQQCSNILGQYNGVTAGVGDYRSSVNAFMVAAKAFRNANPGAAGESAFDTAYTEMVSAAATEQASVAPAMTSLQSQLASACSSKLYYVTTAANAKTAADTALANAQTEKKAADVALSAAEAADTAAYLSVKELCPDFERTVP